MTQQYVVTTTHGESNPGWHTVVGPFNDPKVAADAAMAHFVKSDPAMAQELALEKIDRDIPWAITYHGDFWALVHPLTKTFP